MQTIAGVVIAIGSVLFLVAAFSPISGRVFAPGVTGEQQIAAVEESRTAWLLSSVLFGVGSATAVVGLFLFAISISGANPGASQFTVFVAASIAAVGAIFWLIVIYYRLTNTPEQLFVDGSVGGSWLFPAYTVLTQVALLLIGYVLLTSDFPSWMGWGMIAAVGLTVVVLVIFKDLPPLVHYIWLLVLGIQLIRLP